MAGSKRWFGYQSDNGTAFNVELDESVYESSDLGFVSANPANPVLQATASRPLAMRYVNVSRVANNSTLRGRYYIGTSAAYQAMVSGGTITVDGTVWNISSLRGEKAVITPATDTAQLDGDVDNNFAV